MTLLLGPPSSGKTTLLLALAARLDPKLKVGASKKRNLIFRKIFHVFSLFFQSWISKVWFLDQFSGKVTYNGHGMDEFVPQRTAAYVNQTK